MRQSVRRIRVGIDLDGGDDGFDSAGARRGRPGGIARGQSEDAAGDRRCGAAVLLAVADPARGAKQTAYEVLVARARSCCGQARRTCGTAGAVEGPQSLNVRYGGPALKPSTRYFWRVKVWDAAGQAVSGERDGMVGDRAAEAGCVARRMDRLRDGGRGRGAPCAGGVDHEPGCEGAGAEKGKVQQLAYRTTVTLDKPVRHATLYATGQDTVSAWVNGAQVLAANPFPP